MIGFSNVQFVLVLSMYVAFGALLGAAAGLLLATMLRQPHRTALWDAGIGICGILLGLVVSGWADMHVTFVNSHGLGFRGFLVERGLVLAALLAIALVSARHIRLRNESAITR